MTRWIHGGLVRLAFRRALTPALAVSTAVLLGLLAARTWGPGAVLEGALGAARDPARIERAMARQAIWLGILAWVTPFVVVHAARTIGRWRAIDADWLARAAVGRTATVASTFIGQLAAAAVPWIAVAIVVETTARGDGPTVRYAAAIEPPEHAWIDEQRPLVWSVPDPGRAATLRFDVRLTSGPGMEIAVAARRADGAESRVVRRIGERETIEIALPPGRGDVEVEISGEGGTALVLAETASSWTPAASERYASLDLLAAALLASAAWIALALGLGGWVSAPTASLLLLAAWIALWLAPPALAWLPGAGLPRALGIAGEGRLPPVAGAREILGALACAGAGLALARWSLVRWRSE